MRWRTRLTALHDGALKAVGATRLADYTVATNGVAVSLTTAQARGLAAAAGVVRLERDVKRTVDTSLSPEFLGLSAVPATPPAGNLTVTDNVPTTVATPVSLTASWSGLLPALRYLGFVEYGTGPERTVVAIG